MLGATAKDTGYVFSMLDHPVELKYDGKAMMLSPRQKTGTLQQSKLGLLPKGVHFRSIVKEK